MVRAKDASLVARRTDESSRDLRSRARAQARRSELSMRDDTSLPAGGRKMEWRLLKTAIPRGGQCRPPRGNDLAPAFTQHEEQLRHVTLSERLLVVVNAPLLHVLSSNAE